MAKMDQSRRASAASFIGTTMEWYDFFIYGTASALVFGHLYFPSLDPVNGLLASFATLGAGYIARPIGAIIFGHIGDKLGRKITVVATMTIMGIATFGIGLLPTYQAIGITAPILLVAFRLLQGLAVGGEWGGAVLISSEHAGRGRRFGAGIWVQQGSPAGNILATLTFLLVALLPADDFESWGWRIPFLASALLVVVGLVIRSKIDETPEFVQSVKKNKTVKIPLFEVFRRAPLALLLSALCGAAGVTGYSFVNVFALNWGTTEVGLDRSSMLTAILVMSIAQFLTQPLAAVFADRWGAIRVWVGSLAICIITVPLSYMMVGTGIVWLAALGLCLQMVPLAMSYALLAGLLVEAFPAEIRSSALSLAYNFSSIAFAAIVPVASVALLDATGSIWSVAGFQVAYVLVSLVAAILLSKLTGAGSPDHRPSQVDTDSENGAAPVEQQS